MKSRYLLIYETTVSNYLNNSIGTVRGTVNAPYQPPITTRHIKVVNINFENMTDDEIIEYFSVYFKYSTIVSITKLPNFN